MSNEITDLDWLARNKHEWPGGDHQPWCYVYWKGGQREVSGNCVTVIHPCVKIEMVDWISRRADLQNKPNWVGAPEWAQWVAQHESGYWAWGSGVPNITDHTWAAGAPGPQFIGKMQWSGCAGEVLGNWRDTLEQRPAELSEQAVTERLAEATKIVLAAAPALMDEKFSFDRNDWHELGELPPVGIECIFEPGDGACYFSEEEMRVAGMVVEIIAHTKYKKGAGAVAVFKWDLDEHLGVSTANPSAFRPIRTEREVEIEEMMKTINVIEFVGTPHHLISEISAVMYDAGYRKEQK